MSNVDERLRAVEDRLAIIELEGKYSRFFDDHQGEAWSQLFTLDGIYQARILDPVNPNFVQGRAALERFCNDAPFSGLHLMHLPQITIDGNQARSRIHLEFYGSFRTDEHEDLRMAGYYDVLYSRVDQTWQIKRRITTTFSSDQRIVPGYLAGDGFSAPTI